MLDRDEIDWYVQEFGWSAHAAQPAGADGIDIHPKHADLMEWFVSPAGERPRRRVRRQPGQPAAARAGGPPRHPRPPRRTFDGFGTFLDWQERRVRWLGIDVKLRMRVEVEDALDVAPDVVVVATGNAPRRPGVPGDDRAFLHDVRAVLTGPATSRSCTRSSARLAR